ncbi:hypothetical protein HPP92_015778 [Vanilla planifolia]|uniref:Vta1/callose synthase N-terminal domain-containing protein n=1 Tax=Vanilla planifolia TaxID=51239 RepID=A0A835UW45_VANPL|nr:hypothetical protein HPP92_015778 [Vanilla planifolia]
MASDAEPAKLLLPFLQRADELQKHEPLVAYYCRLYAMERGLKIPQKERTKTTNALLTSLMNQLEKDKKALKLSTEDHLYLEGFATNVFTKADKQDRAGRADLNTAKTFYAASIFFEILNQFGELPPDIEQKLKYAVWKAADIRKALKEGRKPEPGPPGGDKDLLDPSSPQANVNATDSNQSFQTNFPNQTSSDQIEQQDHARQTSFNYTAANVPSQPAYKDPRSENINYSGATSSSSQPTDMPATQGDPYATLHAHTSPSYSSTDYQHYPQTYQQNYNNSYSYEQPSLTQNLLQNTNLPLILTPISSHTQAFKKALFLLHQPTSLLSPVALNQ